MNPKDLLKFGRRRLVDPALDDPTYEDAEPELTEEDLAGRLEDATPIERHVKLGDET